MRHALNFAAVFLLILASAATPASAGIPMADHVPADAVVYAGWAGTDALGGQYARSDLSVFLDHSNLPAVAGELLGKGWDQITAAADNKQTTPALRRAMGLAIKHPVAFYVANLTSDDVGTPKADVALVCDAGTDAAALRGDLKTWIDSQGEIPLVVTGDGPIVMLSTKGAKPAGDQSVANSPRFLTAVKPHGADPAVAVYIDGIRLLSFLNDSADKDERAKIFWPKMRDALGIANLKTYTMTGSFDSGQWVTSSALIAPGERTGLLAVIEPHPADPALMAHVPANATSVSVYNFDVARLYDTLSDAAATIPELADNFHKGAGVGSLFLGRNLRRQILGPLGTQWVVFTDTDSHRLIALNRPNDPKAAEDGLISSMYGIVGLINSQFTNPDKSRVVTAGQKKVDGVALTTAASARVSPTIGVKDGILYVGLSPESVSATIAAAPTPPESDVTHSPAFVAAVKRLGAQAVTTFDYTDLARTAPAAYQAFDKTFDQLHDRLPDLPKPQLPPLDSVKSRLSPAVSISWADENGTYTKSISPFPGATMVVGDPQESLVTVAAITSALAPLIEQLRSMAMVHESIANERTLATGIIAYAKAHGGHQPPDLGSLVAGGYLDHVSARLFVLPTTALEKTPPEKADLVDWVNTRAQYDLLWPGKVVSTDSPRLPVLAERGAIGDDSARPVAFADGHVDLLAGDRLRKLVHQHENPD